ncbi:ABC transporter ATP-binding protein [Stratiformator vulcanicus]|uniref:Daunorubicin/doxorubicin resistance ATP-binding protein DrrA n=1 Tax=Stratiformator vulcanicus TaxID=2527980 RepID=A0A517R570_9PLAN|nr:ABC transporter ATP-binding protein [Stratiformator vulcanicus]QDT39012.1 Daunorubicin/doxorubicin resistance ATP-binding protein DrrA [Stratiformator vulcanicus]
MQTTTPTLSVRDLRKTFGDVTAVDGIDWEARPGECFGLLGPNGAGKTTTIEICEGLTKPDSGTVELFGETWIANTGQLHQRIGVQLQETQFSERLTVEETIRLFRSFYREGRSVEDLLAVVELTEKRNARVATLSGGQKQRVAMACALVGNPDLLFLDEPTTGLDPQARRQLWELVEQFKHEGRTVILTTHYMDEAERLCDRIAIMDRGKIIADGTPKQLIDSLGAAHIVEFSPSIAVQEERFQTLPGVHDVAGEDGRYRLTVDQLHVAVPAVFEALAAEGIELNELTTHSATLEDLFVHLTGRHLRDE